MKEKERTEQIRQEYIAERDHVRNVMLANIDYNKEYQDILTKSSISSDLFLKRE